MTISAKVIADSISSGKERIRITTFELEYPRFIHAEFMTHRMFSRNAASSRAIPIMRQIELIEENLAEPVHWGKHQPGMQADEELSPPRKKAAQKVWRWAGKMACKVGKALVRIGAHKQFVNRILEPWAHIKVVCTATEFDNFFWLRKHKDAQPEIKELAERMWEARSASTPKSLSVGDWHVPYFKEGYWCSEDEMSLEDALMISSSCCAQVSYRKLDGDLDKAKRVYGRLVTSKPVHASPFEHQATPMVKNKGLSLAHGRMETGATHMDKDYYWWSGNFRGWTQHRQLIEDHVCWDYEPD